MISLWLQPICDTLGMSLCTSVQIRDVVYIMRHTLLRYTLNIREALLSPGHQHLANQLVRRSSIQYSSGIVSHALMLKLHTDPLSCYFQHWHRPPSHSRPWPYKYDTTPASVAYSNHQPIPVVVSQSDLWLASML